MIDRAFISDAARSIRENTELIVNAGNAVIAENSLPAEQQMVENSSVKNSMLLEKALTSSMNSADELKAKKLLSAALFIAKNKNLLPAGVPETLGSVESASLADSALTKMKTAYQVASGKMDMYEATDAIIDQATARMLAVSDEVVRKGTDYAIKGLEIYVAATFPPALPVVSVIRYVQPVITQKLQQLVKVGLPKISNFAKKTIRTVGAVIQKKVKTVSKNLMRLISVI